MKKFITFHLTILCGGCFASATIPLKGDILSVSEKEVIVVSESHRVVLNNQKLKLQPGTENCQQRFNLPAEVILNSQKLSRKPTVVCTNKLTKKTGVSR